MAQVQTHVHMSESPLIRPWGGRPRDPFRDSISQTQEEAVQATARSPAISKKKTPGLGMKKKPPEQIPLAGVESLEAGLYRALGLDCIYRDVWGVVHQGCDWLTLGGIWLATGETGHS